MGGRHGCSVQPALAAVRGVPGRNGAARFKSPERVDLPAELRHCTEGAFFNVVVLVLYRPIQANTELGGKVSNARLLGAWGWCAGAMGGDFPPGDRVSAQEARFSTLAGVRLLSRLATAARQCADRTCMERQEPFREFFRDFAPPFSDFSPVSSGFCSRYPW
jgi:hypothetical protein